MLPIQAFRVASRLLQALFGALVLAMPCTHQAHAAPPLWMPNDGEQQHFRILDGKHAIGDLRLRYSRRGDALVLERRQTMSVRWMAIEATVDQTSIETWTAGKFDDIRTRTELDSIIKHDVETLELSRTARGISGQSSREVVELPGDAVPLSLWNAGMLHDGTFFDPGSGKRLSVHASNEPSKASTPAGVRADRCLGKDLEVVDTDHHESQAVIWSSPDGRICAMRFHSTLGTYDYVPAGG